jgi:glycosyltransferase involved in cell wall biosynthesis
MSESLTIWLLQTGEPLHIDEGNPRPMRAMNLANELVASGHRVVLWSSFFYHQEKRHRLQESNRIRVSPGLEIRLIKSPGYSRNIGPGRLWDHALLARNLAFELSTEDIAPDVAFIGYPPIEAAAVMTRWLAIRGVPCMLDVKDQWPTIFIDALPAPLKLIGRIALAPYFYFGRRAMREATALSAMADSFLQWAVNFAGRKVNQLDLVVPLTTPTGQVSLAELEEASCWWDQQGIKADGTQRIIFVGSHSPAFDIDPVCEAVMTMARTGSSCQFVFCGDGPESSEWRQKLAGLTNVFFPGWVGRDKIEALANRSSAALAPYRNSEDFMMSIPNKVIDSFALGLPVLSPLKGEVGILISEFAVGMSYGSSTGKTLLQCIEDLATKPGLRDALSANASKLFQKRFSFETVYNGLVNHLEMLASKRSQ